jgi:hypothetical protein
MAAELAADLAEADTAEEVLGSDAADARSFASAWASERGVVPRRTRNPRVMVPAAAAGLAVVALAGAVLMATPSSRSAAQPAAAESPDPRPELPKSERVRVVDGPPLHVSYVTTPAFKATRVESSPANTETHAACVDGVDLTATPCVWPPFAHDIATEDSAVNWPRVGLGVTLFGGVGLILLASLWLWSHARRSRIVLH